ncbi:prenyltransferase/squalene oxidase repeat-containing protein [Aporhodopirellula aestuarii]|uniref:Terpene cyclase/mutase family protein n=1 Tax=Aporhodopirellula aestuarii TaxID=2950107 RepID=A0ABT0U8E6_9BACT|nr:prenyltransferase/squalene oxidase repeat-containing protein [Aporhodopirellula aestuarii]MCM2373192.1 terpene cyclase/mutase family protein [Aporhodopirellula aestuarii]
MSTTTEPSPPDLESLPTTLPVPDEDTDDEVLGAGRFGFLKDAPAWLISTLIHVGILLTLGLVSLTDPVRMVNVLSATATGEEGPEIEEFTIEEIDPGEMEVVEDVTEPVEMTESLEMAEPVAVDVPMDIAAVPLDVSDLAAEMAPTAATLQTLASVQMSAIDSRSEKMKKKLLREYGGNSASEAAVTEALKWISLHQMRDGRWTFAHNLVCNNACGDGCVEKRATAFNGATAMALLPFLGAGQTHKSGDFQEVVRRGLQYLIRSGKPGMKSGLPVLDLSERDGNMYSHGLATIALSEAYAMTEDPTLAAPTQAAINYIVAAQCRDGGWRYDFQDARGGDTSVVGWQIMALKSGYMGHLIVPPQTIQGSMMFLDKVQSNGGAWYGYAKPETKLRPATTAVGLLCRMYTGWDKNNKALQEGVKGLAKTGVLKNDIYYNYYAAQVLRQNGGPEWDAFNTKLRDWLVETQAQDGGAKGSWHFHSKHVSDAGRLCVTSFATMILEVYYRHMPLYTEQSAEDDFPL